MVVARLVQVYMLKFWIVFHHIDSNGATDSSITVNCPLDNLYQVIVEDDCGFGDTIQSFVQLCTEVNN